MIQVSFNFDERKFRKSVEKEMKVKGKQEIESKLRGLSCPDHGGTPTVTAHGSLSGKMSWNVNTCCDKLMNMVKARIGDDSGKSVSDMLHGPSVKDMLGGPSVKDVLGGSYSGGIGE